MSIKEFTYWWNNTFVLDYWYRQKHKLPFNSEQHREVEPLSIMFEWEEDQIGTIIRNNQIEKKLQEDYLKTGNWLLPQKQQPISEDFYDNLDWDKFDNK